VHARLLPYFAFDINHDPTLSADEVMMPGSGQLINRCARTPVCLHDETSPNEIIYDVVHGTAGHRIARCGQSGVEPLSRMVTAQFCQQIEHRHARTGHSQPGFTQTITPLHLASASIPEAMPKDISRKGRLGWLIG